MIDSLVRYHIIVMHPVGMVVQDRFVEPHSNTQQVLERRDIYRCSAKFGRLPLRIHKVVLEVLARRSVRRLVGGKRMWRYIDV